MRGWIPNPKNHSVYEIGFDEWSATRDGVTIPRMTQADAPLRLWLLVTGRTNNWGHAAFKFGELARLYFDLSEGQTADREQRRRTRKMLAHLVEIGLFCRCQH